MNRESFLPTQRLDPGVSIAQAQPWSQTSVTLESPALAVMTDLSQVKAATTSRSTTLRQAEQMMIFQGVRMLFVVTDVPSFEGLITSADLSSDKQMRAVHDRGVRYDELCVGDVMTELHLLDAIDFADLKTAVVGNLVATLQRFGRSHLLVVEQASATAPRRVRGVVSRAQIERQLGAPVDVTPVANSFAEIERALA